MNILGSGTVYRYTLFFFVSANSVFHFWKSGFHFWFSGSQARALDAFPAYAAKVIGGHLRLQFFTLGASGGRSLQLGQGWPNWGSALVRAGCMVWSRQFKKRVLHDCLDHSMGHADGQTAGGTLNNIVVTTVLSFP